MHREDKKFTHNSRIFNNSWYLLVDQSNESNTKKFPSFGCIWKAIQWFMQKIILCTFCRIGTTIYYEMVDIRLTGCGMGQIWHLCLPIVSSYAICRPQALWRSLGEIFFVPFVFPSLFQMSLWSSSSFIHNGEACADSQIAVGSRYQTFLFKIIASYVCIL